MATVPGRGYAGLGTSGPENTKTQIGRPNISGKDIERYPNKSKGIKIKSRSAKKKTKINNPII